MVPVAYQQNLGYSTGIAMLLSNVFCRDATRSAKKINPHANPALNPRYSRAEISLMPASRRADTTWPPSVIDRGHARLPVCRNKSLFSQNDECTGAIKKNIVRLVKTAIEDY